MKLNDLHQAKHLTLKRSKQFVLGFNLQKEIKFQLITTAVTNIRKQPKVNDFHQANIYICGYIWRVATLLKKQFANETNTYCCIMSL